MLSKRQLRRLAKEARVLSMDIVRGIAPKLGRAYAGKCACAVGTAAKRARVDWWGAALAIGEYHNVFRVSRELPPAEVYVFPLLALADALENAAEPPSAIEGSP